MEGKTILQTDSIKKFEEALGGFLVNGNIDTLNWFLDTDSKYNSNLLELNSIVDSLGNLLGETANQDENIFNQILTKYGKKHGEKIKKMFSALINIENHEQATTLLKIFSEKHKEWPNEITKELEKKLLKTARELDYPQNSQMLETIILIASGTVYNQLKPIAEKILPWITDGDINKAKEGTRLLGLINEKASPIEPFGVQGAIDRTPKLLEENNVDFATMLLKYIFNNSKQLSPTQFMQTANIIKNQLVKEKPEALRNVGFNFVPQIIEQGRRYNILKQVLELAKTAKEPNTQNRCKELLRNFKKKLTSEEKDEAKSIFEDTLFD